MNTKPIWLHGSASVWLSPWQLNHRSANEIISEMISGREGVHTPAFLSMNARYGDHSDPWVKIGTAEILLSLTTPDGIAAVEIAALQAKLEAMRAQHSLAQKEMLDRISKLSAIPYGQ